ncbi:MAG: DUF2799 domain-containing protein [Roseibium sp.]|uniref:DUF2799 domain-containing protein n=1 Tax=Roseibium sp. TaxID=1936156 RepID=UPI002608CE53|nr:DUF2799 domain-containing protein [Roseibium sp.]MCV0425659.1 DUF2799 domain-containing protein [Roseibium sp.]
MKSCLGIVLAALAVASLGGCAAVTKEQCVAGDWADLGNAHASVGKPADHLDEVVKSCGKHGITPDTRAYLSGWNQGLQNYCTPLNGFTLGKQNKQRSSICPPQMANGFNQAYQLGNVIWKANDRVSQAESKILSLENTVDALNDKLHDTKCKDKKKDDLKDCRRKRRRLRDDLSDAEYDLDAARYDLDDVRAEAEFVSASINVEAARLFAW